MLREKKSWLSYSRRKSSNHPRASKKGYPLKYILKTIGIARSTYYFEINSTDAIAKRNEELSETIKEVFTQNKGRYGVRRVYRELRNRCVQVYHKCVQRLMHDLGLFGKRSKEKYHSYEGEVGKVAENIINRDFSTTAQLQKWTTDVSQFNFPWGK